MLKQRQKCQGIFERIVTARKQIRARNTAEGRHAYCTGDRLIADPKGRFKEHWRPAIENEGDGRAPRCGPCDSVHTSRDPGVLTIEKV